MDTTKTSLAAALMDYFGKKPGGQTTMEFMAELKELDTTDRQWFVEALRAIGYTHLPNVGQ